MKYHVEGIDSIGVFGNEPFSVEFKNNTPSKVQVKISIDGTDVLTGKLADTEINDQMWVVNAYSTLTLKAWCESHDGGAKFVFTNGNNSVSLHTHGDTSHAGIISAAVFTESHVEKHYGYRYGYLDTWIHNSGLTYPSYQYNSYLGNGTYCSNAIPAGSSKGVLRSMSTNSFSVSADVSDSLEFSETSAAVGAGEYTEQKIKHVTGLVKPMFAEFVKVRYMWWDHLAEKLNTVKAATSHPSGFPGHKEPSMVNLGSVPRVTTENSNTKTAKEYKRFVL